jgi:poly(A) polymerase
VFDEMLKLLLSGHALACLRELRSAGLHHGLLPLLDVVLEQPIGMKFVTLALESTDGRVKAGKGVSPGFLFASLLWHQVLEKWNAYRAAGEAPIPALHLAADDVLETQTENLALQRRIATDMRDIWAMQPRFERRTGKAPFKLLEHPRFRAGYDFLLLRCESGELPLEVGEWWTAFYDAEGGEREQLLAAANARGGRSGGHRGGASQGAGDAHAGEGQGGDGQPAKRKRAPRRGPRKSGGGEGAVAHAQGGGEE